MQAWIKSKAPDKIFTIKNINQSKILTGLVLALLFYSGSASAELAYLCFAFLRFWFRVRRVGSAAIWRSPKYIMPVIGQPWTDQLSGLNTAAGV